MIFTRRDGSLESFRAAHMGSDGLAAAAQRAGIDFGWAWNNANRTTWPLPTAIVQQDSTILTDGGKQLWSTTEPSQNTFVSNTGGRSFVDWATSIGKPVVQGGHLVWHSALPAWVSAVSGRTNMIAAMEGHIAGVMGMFTDVRHWNVVNEMIHAGDTTGDMRNSVFRSQIGADYVEIALRKARAVDATAKLILNQDHLDHTYTDSLTEQTSFYNLVSSLVASGVPLNGIGTQMHLRPNNTRTGTQVATYLQQFCDLGLDVYITELDLWDETNSQFTLATREADIAALVLDVVGKICQNVTRLKHIICWSVTDADSWMLTNGNVRSDAFGRRFAPYSFGGAQTAFVTALKSAFALRVP